MALIIMTCLHKVNSFLQMKVNFGEADKSSGEVDWSLELVVERL